MRVGAVQHGAAAVGEPRRFADTRLDLSDDPAGFVVLVERLDEGDFLPTGATRPERLLRTVHVLDDDRVGGVEDALARAVVDLERDHECAGKRDLEVQDVPDVRAAPRVDRLIRVADDHEVLVTLGEQFHETELRPVGVLILVHEDERKTFPVPVQQLRIVLEELDRLHEQVVEVERVLVLEGLLVLGEDTSHVANELIEGTLRVLREGVAVDELVLGLADLGANRLGTPPFGVEPYRFLNALHEPKRVVGIEDAEGAVPAQAIRVAA